MDLLSKVKIALGVVVNVYDAELTSLIEAAKLDMGIAGVVLPETLDALVERAIITYCKYQFSALSDGEYDRVKRSYDEQKGQLAIATGYTDWSV